MLNRGKILPVNIARQYHENYEDAAWFYFNKENLVLRKNCGKK